MKKIATAVIALVAVFSTFIALPACETMSMNDTQNGQQQDENQQNNNDETLDQGGEENPDNDDETQKDSKQVTQEQWENALSEESFKNCHLNINSFAEIGEHELDFLFDADNKLMTFKENDMIHNAWSECIIYSEKNYYDVYIRSSDTQEKWYKLAIHEYDSNDYNALTVAYTYSSYYMDVFSNLKNYYSSFTYCDEKYVATNIHNIFPDTPQEYYENITVTIEFSKEKLASIIVNNTGSQYKSTTTININDYGTTKITLPNEFTEVGAF